jgi:multicomponent Na+:H+ antiporter subunit D
MSEHLTVLLVVLPLVCAPITALLPQRSLAWFVSLLLAVTLLVISSVLITDVTRGVVLHYELGGWSPPWGIAYEIDALNALIALIVSGMAVVTLIFAPRSIAKEVPKNVAPIFYACFQLCLLGLLGIALTGDVFNLFVFLEISSLSSYALIAMGRDRKALRAALNYLILGTVGATFFLIGVGMLYAASGSLNMADISNRFAEFADLQLVVTALLFILLGVALKAAIFPLHSWLPDAYAQAPSVISMFLAATATKVAIYVLIRCLYNVFPPAYWVDIVLPDLMIVFGCIAIIYGSYRAIGQKGLKRLLAYSSVAQIGYMVVGIGLLNATGMKATMLHLFNHALMKATLFMAAGVILYRTNTTVISELRGLGREMPWTFAALVIGALSLIGVPGTVGFISKWYLIQSALEAGHLYVVLVIVLGSVLAVVYVWKIIEALYFTAELKTQLHHFSSGTTEFAKTPVSMVFGMLIMSVSCIVFGLYTDVVTELAQTTVNTLFPIEGGVKP